MMQSTQARNVIAPHITLSRLQTRAAKTQQSNFFFL